jgi:hypothetical protein
MKSRRKRIAAGVAALAALALGGAAIAGAGGVFDDETPLQGQELARASAAALAATGGGTVNETERDGEKGATYEVEVTKPDGSTVDVRLDSSYRVVAIDSDSEQQDDD